MYVRFITHTHDEDSGRRQGLFQAMAELRKNRDFPEHDAQIYNEIYDWFRHNLSTPNTFTRSARPHAKNVAISWFKDTASEHISKMRAAAQILQAHGVIVEVLYVERPGYIVYEDEFQVTAEPFKETTT